jgi:hypothetical protein
LTPKKDNPKRPGAKPLPEEERLFPYTFRLTKAQREYARKQGGSAFVRRLIEHAMQDEQQKP